MAGSTSSLLWAEWRRGLKDLQNAVLNPFNGHTATHEEAGSIAHPTQAMVTRDIQGQDDFKGMLNEYASRSTPQQEQQMER
jgi:hypothetical protein